MRFYSALAILSAALTSGAQFNTTLASGNRAPQIEATTLNGGHLSSGQLKGKVILWSFWATYCSVCREEIPALQQLDREFGDRGLVIIGVSLDEDISQLRRFVQENNLCWPQIHDGKSGPVAKLFNVVGPPTKWLVDAEGRIVGTQLEGEKLRAAIEASLNRSGDTARERSSRLPEILQALALKPGSQVADIGAGKGFATRRLARVVGSEGRVWAVDIDEKDAIPELRKMVRKEALSNVEVVVGGVDDPKLPNDRFDGVLIMNAYHEMQRHEDMLRRVFEALRLGGRVAIVDNAPRKTRSRPRVDQTKNHVLAPELAEAELKAAGFAIVIRLDDFSSPDQDSEDSRWMIVAERR
jgi:predicted methyltransferase/thiol-disulfide isomerase/thioredoxin